jgi:hypothetical protein
VKVVILENDLMWSVRLQKRMQSLGYDAQVIDRWTDEIPYTDIAVINMRSREFPLEKTVDLLKEKKVFILGHVGHKESDLILLGKNLNIDKIVTNSMMIHKLEEILKEISDNLRRSGS